MSYDALLEAIKKAQARAGAGSQSGTSPATPPATAKPKRKRAKRERKPAKPALDVDALRGVLKDIVREAVQEAYLRGLEEGIRRAREPTEENIIRTVWNSEPSGVKLSNLCLVFGRERSNEVQQKLLELEARSILVRDRNRWWHVNPRHAETILAHYGIEYSDEELRAIRRRLRNRITDWDSLLEPDL